MMIKSYKTDWLAALRSGEFKQAEGKMQTSCGNCCLGVLAVINGQAFRRNVGEVGAYEPVDSPDIICDASNLNDDGRRKFGLTDFDCTILTSLNDGQHDPDHNPDERKFSFLEIAMWIEAHL